jgi:ribonucleoside-diphosphate reductase alpha chain
MPDGSRQECEVADYAYALWRRLKGDLPLPEYFVDAQVLEPKDHLAMLAAMQRHIDSAISKTINLPADIPFEAFKDVYAQAYALGCKGCTTYRPNEVTGAVLQVKPQAEPELPLGVPSSTKPADMFEAGGVTYLTEPLSRPEELPGQTYKVKWPDSDHALYLTNDDVIQDGRRRPFEIFINSKNMEHYAWTVALTRMISAVFRRGGDVAFVAEELKAVFDPRGGGWVGGKYVPSLVAQIGALIERHMVAIGFLNPPTPLEEQELLATMAIEAAAAGVGSTPEIRRAAGMRQCPKCGQAALIRQENCDRCTSCDYSKC